MGGFRVSTNPKSGKCYELPRKSKTNFFKPPVGGGGSFRGSQNKKSGKFHELPRKSIHYLTPSEDGEREGRTGGDREGERDREAGRE